MVNISVRWTATGPEFIRLSKPPRREAEVLGKCIGVLKDNWAYSSVWLERTPDKREVDGSNPSRPTTFLCKPR